MSTSTAQPSAKFWDRIADGYSKKPVADEAAYQKKLAVTRDYLRPHMDVLEFGCGTGSTALVHAPYVKHIRAIDVSAKMIEIAQRKAAAAAVGNVSFEQASIENLSVPDETFDVVLGLSILHLLRDREVAIAKVHDMLKPGGLFVSSTVCLGGSLKVAPFRLILPLGRMIGRLPLLRFFTIAELKTSLTGAGFHIDHEWQPRPERSVFMVAKKAG